MPSDELATQVRELHAQGLISSRIADAASCSRSRVSQILQELGLTPNPLQRKSVVERHCRVCSAVLTAGQLRLCGACRCVTFTCDNCGTGVTIPRYEYEYRARTRKGSKWHCSNHCKGVHLGNTYGFKQHPENIYRANSNPMKRCPRCGETKPRTEFYPSTAGRIHSLCRPCVAAYGREWRVRQRSSNG